MQRSLAIQIQEISHELNKQQKDLLDFLNKFQSHQNEKIFDHNADFKYEINNDNQNQYGNRLKDSQVYKSIKKNKII